MPWGECLQFEDALVNGREGLDNVGCVLNRRPEIPEGTRDEVSRDSKALIANVDLEAVYLADGLHLRVKVSHLCLDGAQGVVHGGIQQGLDVLGWLAGNETGAGRAGVDGLDAGDLAVVEGEDAGAVRIPAAVAVDRVGQRVDAIVVVGAEGVDVVALDIVVDGGRVGEKAAGEEDAG